MVGPYREMKSIVSMRLYIFLWLAFIAESAVVRQQRIDPSLDPKSDKKFFGKDYPWDKRPIAGDHYVFDHPYPAVQDSEDFDKDYVKDENSDGGMWDAHMQYDTLRSKIVKENKKLKELEEKMTKEYEDWMRAKTEAEMGKEALEKAQEDVKAARGKAEAAAKRVNELEGSSQKDGTKVGGAIGQAVKDVNKEMDDLEKCKEALAEAKKRLKDVLKKKEKLEAAEKKVKAAKEKKAKAEAEASAEAKQKAEEEEKAAAKEKAEAEDEEEAREEKAEAAHKEVEKETKEASSWKKTYLKELEDVRHTEKELEEAARTLKRFRREPYVDKDGGIYNVPSEKSSATRISSQAVVAIAASAVFRLRG